MTTTDPFLIPEIQNLPGPRPSLRTPGVIDDVAAKLADECLDGDERIGGRDRDQVISDLKRVLGYGRLDGFALAKELDSLGWTEVYAETVERLDTASYWTTSIIDIAVAAWAAGRAAELQIPDGARVETPWGPGKVLSRDAKMLAYTVRRDGQPDNTWSVVPAEWCNLVAQTAEVADV